MSLTTSSIPSVTLYPPDIVILGIHFPPGPDPPIATITASQSVPLSSSDVQDVLLPTLTAPTCYILDADIVPINDHYTLFDDPAIVPLAPARLAGTLPWSMC